MAQQVLQQQLYDKSQQKNTNTTSKFYSNKCAKQFLQYIESIDCGINYQQAKIVNEQILNYYSTDKEKSRSQEYMRNMLQALSFNLTPDQAGELFKKAMDAEVPNKGQFNNQKKTGREVYEEMYKVLNKHQ